jgi:preprotein translocase subunit SecD
MTPPPVKKSKLGRNFAFILLLFFICTLIALPDTFSLRTWGLPLDFDKKQLDFTLGEKTYSSALPLKRGLDIAGGVQLTLQAQMDGIASEDQLDALQAATEVVRSRVDAYGLAEPLIQTAVSGDDHRIIVELPGLTDIDQALSLIGTTALMDFRLQDASKAAAILATQASGSADDVLTQYLSYLDSFVATDLTGTMLKKATPTFDGQTNQPVIGLQFTPEGRELFAQITQEHTGEVLGIFIDGWPVTTPTINTPILDGNAIITGAFNIKETQELAVQLNSGALPVPLNVLSQSQIGASLGDDSVQASIFAGVVGLALVCLFMILTYGPQGLIADLGLVVYAVITLALYKVMGVTLTLPSIAALLISIGMAVDANILIFSRFKEELVLGKPFARARELSFGRAWDSIRDANTITIMTALILINPFEFSFLNSSGTIRGFGITLLLGVVIGLFTGIVVTRTLMRIFLTEKMVKLPLSAKQKGADAD